MILRIGRRDSFVSEGFTLVELTLVSAIIVILVGVSAPLFRRTYYEIQLDESCYNISRFMNYARSKAVSESVNAKFNFDFEKGGYWLTINDDPEKPGYFKRIEGRLGRRRFLPPGITMEGAGSYLVFYPNGRCDDFEIKLANKNGSKKVIRVKKETGWADVFEEKD